MRETRTVIITDRGAPKAFTIREMPAFAFEDWLNSVGDCLYGDDWSNEPDPMAVARALYTGGPAPLYLVHGGLELLRELESCCSVPFRHGEMPLSPELAEEYIDDLGTLLMLRREVLKLNLRFLAGKKARRELNLPREWAFRKALKGRTFAKPANVPGIVGSVLGQGMASMADMQSAYGFTDALNMLEVLNVRNYNQWAAQEAANHAR